jgi:hypothetical protein
MATKRRTTFQCDGCGDFRPRDQLDRVWITHDSLGSDLYCKSCWPLHRQFDWDSYQGADKNTVREYHAIDTGTAPAVTIWTLFGEANDYDQPPHNLVAWWPDKPDLANVAAAVGESFPAALDPTTVSIVKLWSGGGTQTIDGVHYTLRQIGPGIVPIEESDR